ncbi:hypothetical protein BKA64DRAFT_742516 [Cadophora sp. MPI-SDFR-AT-0126]|nr:hypothetical protein BKA64DRAFT_742516 [Leotiomycetes sp. MPI-SDFR-AT-0126]
MESIDTIAKAACAACKQYKRKCDKVLPCCSTCKRLQRECTYLDPAPRVTAEEEITLLRARVEHLEKLVDNSIFTKNLSNPETDNSASIGGDISRKAVSNLYSSLFFLDQRYFTHLHREQEPLLLPITRGLAELLEPELSLPEGLGQLVSRYLDAVQGWMPIVSRMRMRRVLDRPTSDIKADTAFLLSCMKLVLQDPESQNFEAQSLYKALKASYLELEQAGVQSLRLIQGGLMIAVYELGHGIYPAAYTTVGICARQAISLGINRQVIPQFLQPWPEWEEEIRVWWFVMMLDRHVTVGRELRPLCTEDPRKNMPLPADIEAWDQGVMAAPERLYISSPMAARSSSFARLAQAYNLLGRVIQHCDDQDQDLSFMLDELSTLDQATSSLMEVARNDINEDLTLAISICFVTLMKLHKNFLPNSFYQGYADETADPILASCIRQNNEHSFNVMRDTALQVVDFAQGLEQRTVIVGISKTSPMILHSLYRAAFWLSYLSATNREDRFVLGRAIIDRALRALSVRWKLAGVYLDILGIVDDEHRDKN